MSKKTNNITYTRFVYSLIEFFSTEIQLPFEVSSYIMNDQNQDCQFARKKICKYIERNRERESKNRLFLTISINDTGTKQQGRDIIRTIVEQTMSKFFENSLIEILKKIDENAFIEIFSSKEHYSFTDYIIVIFNVSKCSSIECIISTNSMTSKLIERDEDGDVVEFNSKLHSNLRSFKNNLHLQ